MKQSTRVIETEVSNTLLAAGLHANHSGYLYLKDSVILVLKYPYMQHQLTKKLYPEVAKIHKVSPAIVERSMRHTINNASKNGGIYNINYMLNAQYFNEKDRPCNGCFIALIVEIVRKNLYELIANLEEQHTPDKLSLAKEIEEDLGSIKNDYIA